MHQLEARAIFAFFFQAEDGIRDPLVTGVRTCALPIWGRPGPVGCLRVRPGPGRMTEVAVGGLESAAEPTPDADRFPCFDGFRATAALSVLLLHVAGSSGETQRNHVVGSYLARLDVGVAVFFLISGFLLYRPFAAAHLTGGRAPAALPFFRRRFLRIYPAYWVATTAVVYVFRK